MGLSPTTKQGPPGRRPGAGDARTAEPSTSPARTPGSQPGRSPLSLQMSLRVGEKQLFLLDLESSGLNKHLVSPQPALVALRYVGTGSFGGSHKTAPLFSPVPTLPPLHLPLLPLSHFLFLGSSQTTPSFSAAPCSSFQPATLSLEGPPASVPQELGRAGRCWRGLLVSQLLPGCHARLMNRKTEAHRERRLRWAEPWSLSCQPRAVEDPSVTVASPGPASWLWERGRPTVPWAQKGLILHLTP